MTLHILDIEQRGPEWFAARCGMVTASVVGQLLTPTLKVASNDTSRSVTAALVAERVTGWSESTYANFDMQRGIEHEPIAREKYAEVNKVDVAEVGLMILERDGWRLGYSPDGLVGDDGLIEIKCPRAKGHLSTVVAGEVPAYYMAQCQAALFVSGRQWIDYVSFCSGMPLWTKRVLPDPKWHDAIADAVTAFEEAAESLASDYLSAVAGLPATERIDNDLGLVF
jgi:hypothetical protein